MRKLLLAGAAVPLLLGGVWLIRSAEGSAAPAYRTAVIERGDIEASVSATGKLGAVTTVQVGTQVSGQVSAIHVDFNDRVTKGQLIARIDPTLQQQTVRDAQAGLERAQAELLQAQREYDRNRQLFDARIITASEFEAIEYRHAVALASVKSAQVTVDRARQNLAYTSIYAPIDGIVVERNVDVGQTVAASLSAPQLFLIANDLEAMQILASVDESDIGLIREGQPVRFTVQAYPGEPFTGAVRQVRLQSATTENVVSYTAVIAVANTTGRLLPGMTATVSFITGAAEDVLLVPNAALRFRPAAEVLADAAGTGPRRAGGAMLWTAGDDGAVHGVRARTGITDGQRTEVSGDGIAEGMQVIVGATQGGSAATTGAAASPFQPATPQGGPRRPGGF